MHVVGCHHVIEANGWQRLLPSCLDGQAWHLHSLMYLGQGASSAGGQDHLVHAHCQAANCIGTSHVLVVHWSWFGARHTGVIIVDVPSVQMAVV